MDKRTFLKNGLFVTASAFVLPFINACKSGLKTEPAARALPAPLRKRTSPFELGKLPYDFAALEPHIDKQTMEIHHDKHHQAYVNNLNDAVKGTAYEAYELDDILQRITTADADKKIRNNAGGHWNHTFFWNSMTAGGAFPPSGALTAAIDRDFGGMDKFKEQFSNASKGVFGSGWAWLCINPEHKLFITATPNQDNPLMAQVSKTLGTPLLGIDVWEHAYYIKYQNKRADYVTAFYNVVNWKEISVRYEKAVS